MSKNKQSLKTVDGDVDVIAIAITLWHKRKLIVKSIIIFTLLGLLIAIFSSNKYTVSTTIVPQTADSKSSLGSLSGLAAMAGFNLNITNSSDLSPSFYPQIMSSVTYQLELMNTPIQFEDVNHPLTLFQYYTDVKRPSLFKILKKYTFGLPKLIANSLPNKNQTFKLSDSKYIKFTEDQKDISELLSDQLNLEVNDQDGYITLSCEMNDAAAAAQLTQNAILLLQKYITSFKIEKAQAQKDFIEQRFIEKKQEFDSIQEKLARFQDEHKNIKSAMAKIQEAKLSAEYNMLSGVYTELGKQLEQAQIQVKEDTPVFTIIQPVSIPIEKSSPKRLLIISLFIFLGVTFSISIIFAKIAWNKIQLLLIERKDHS